MPPGLANRTRRLLPGGATTAVAVCSFRATSAKEADQHLTTRQQRCEDFKKRSFSLRSHARDPVDARSHEHGEKGLRCATTHRSAAGALSGGKHQQQRNGPCQRHGHQQHCISRCRSLSKSDVAACCSEDQNAPTKPLKFPVFSATRSAPDAKNPATVETSLEKLPTTDATPVTTAEHAVLSSGADSAHAVPDPVSSETASTKEDEDALQNDKSENTERAGDSQSCKGASEKSDEGGSKETSPKTLFSLGSSGALQSREMERVEGSLDEELGSTGTHIELEEKDAQSEKPHHEEREASSTEGGPQSPDEGASLSPASSLVIEDDIGPASSAATMGRNYDSHKTPVAEPPNRQGCLVPAAGSHNGQDANGIYHRREGHQCVGEQQRGLPEDGALCEADVVQGCHPKVAQPSESITEEAKPNPTISEESAPVKDAGEFIEEHNNAPQAVAENKEKQQQRTRNIQASANECITQLGGQLDEKHALWKALRTSVRSDESDQLSPPASPEDQRENEEGERHVRRQSLGGGGAGREVYKQVPCVIGGASETQEGGQRAAKNEDIRFFLRLSESGGGISSPRSVHVSSAFLKDSWRAQRFFCKLFSVDIGEVIGLVDDQGFVSPFDGEELFIRNGGTYTLELAPNARRGDVTEPQGKNLAADLSLSDSCTSQLAYQGGRASGCPVRGGIVREESPRTNWESNSDGKKGTWNQSALATQTVPERRGPTTQAPGGEQKRSLGHLVPGRTAHSLHEQEASSQRHSIEKCLIAGPLDRTALSEEGTFQNGQKRAVSDVVTSPYHSLPSADRQQTWRQSVVSTWSSLAGGRIMDKSKESLMLHGQDDIDTRNKKKVRDEDESGEDRKMLEQPFSSSTVATNRVTTRSVRRPQECVVSHAPAFESNESKQSRILPRERVDTSLRGGGGEVLNEKKVQEVHDRGESQNMMVLKQEATSQERSFALQQRLRRGDSWPALGDSREDIERSALHKTAADTQGERRNEQQWRSASHVEEVASTDATDDDLLSAQVGAKRCRLEDGQCSTTSQRLGTEGQYAARSALPTSLPVVEDELLHKKQHQGRQSSSKLWISAPLLVWRRRRLQRSLALHDPEDPEEVAARQLVAEQHVRAVLARVSQRKALRNHLHTGTGAHTEQGSRESDTTKLFRKEMAPPLPTVSSRSRSFEGHHRSMMNNPSLWPSSRSSSAALGYGEPLLMDSLLWKKATTEKIYVHQASSYSGNAHYTTRENTGTMITQHESFGRRKNPLPLSGDHNHKHVVNQQHSEQQQPWREVQQRSSEPEPSGAPPEPVACTRKEEIGVVSSREDKLKEEDDETSRFARNARDLTTAGLQRQYLLRPRLPHTQIRPAAYREENKEYSCPPPGINTSSSQRRQVQQSERGTAPLRDEPLPCLNEDRYRNIPFGVGERQSAPLPPPSFPRRSDKLNKTEQIDDVHGYDGESSKVDGAMEDARIRRYRTEGSAVQELLLNTERINNAASPRTFSGTSGEVGGASRASSADVERHSASISSSSRSYLSGSVDLSGDGQEPEKPERRSQRHAQQQFSQQVLEKRLFTSSELQRLLAVLETLKAPKQHQQQHSLVERLRVLLPPHTFSNLKVLLPSLLKTAERLTKTDTRDKEKSVHNRESRRRMSTEASEADENDTDTLASLNANSECDAKDKDLP